MGRIQTFAIALLLALIATFPPAGDARPILGGSTNFERHPIIHLLDISKSTCILVATCIEGKLAALSIFMLFLPDRRRLGICLTIIATVFGGLIFAFPKLLRLALEANRM